MSRKSLKRTPHIWSIALLIIVLTLSACGETSPTATPVANGNGAPTATTGGGTGTGTGTSTGTLNGVTLPADAAPADQQVYVVHYDNTGNFTTLDFLESVYGRAGAI